MTIQFDLPMQIEEALRASGQEPSAAAKEAALVEFFRLRRITHHQLAEALGVHRLELDAILKRHDVPLDFSLADLHRDLATLQRSAAR